MHVYGTPISAGMRRRCRNLIDFGGYTMRAKLKRVRSLYGEIWQVSVPGNSYHYYNFDTALKFLNRYLKRAYKESSAYSMSRSISSNTQSGNEQDLVRKLVKVKCRGIS